MMFASSILRLWVQFKEETRMKKLIALVLAAMLCMAACAALASFSGPEAEFLRALAEYTITRAA